jgi:hypothetical protein
MLARPDLEILRPVVVANPVSVVHGLSGSQAAAEDPLNLEPMRSHALSRHGDAVITVAPDRAVARSPDQAAGGTWVSAVHPSAVEMSCAESEPFNRPSSFGALVTTVGVLAVLRQRRSHQHSRRADISMPSHSVPVAPTVEPPDAVHPSVYGFGTSIGVFAQLRLLHGRLSATEFTAGAYRSVVVPPAKRRPAAHVTAVRRASTAAGVFASRGKWADACGDRPDLARGFATPIVKFAKRWSGASHPGIRWVAATSRMLAGPTGRRTSSAAHRAELSAPLETGMVHAAIHLAFELRYGWTLASIRMSALDVIGEAVFARSLHCCDVAAASGRSASACVTARRPTLQRADVRPCPPTQVRHDGRQPGR